MSSLPCLDFCVSCRRWSVPPAAYVCHTPAAPAAGTASASASAAAPDPQRCLALPPAACRAYRALDMTEQPGIGKLLISFSNPVKANDPNRPGSAGGSHQQRQSYNQQQQQQQQRAGAPAGGRGGGGLGAQQRGGAAASGASGGYPKLPAGAAMVSWQ